MGPPSRIVVVRALLRTAGGLAFAAGACAACGKTTVPSASSPPAAPATPATPAAAATIDLVIADPLPAPAAAPPRELPATTAASEPLDAGTEELPRAWSDPAIPKLAFADALQRARSARDAFVHLTPPRIVTGADAGADSPLKRWFTAAHVLVDRASRMFAAAFHAADAPREGRIDAIAEAAELALDMSIRLDDAGLVAMPPTWRSDPAVAGSFEDVAVGPTRRFREEARTLARACIETARELAVATAAARRCATLRTGAPPVRRNKDAGACACSAGDPLCSASLGGWCD